MVVPEKYYDHAKNTGKIDEKDRLIFSYSSGVRLFPHTVTQEKIDMELKMEKAKLTQEQKKCFEVKLTEINPVLN
jgi:hypothetical protein